MDMARLLLYGEEDGRRATQVCEDVRVGVEAGSWNVFHVSLKGVARHRLSYHICVSEISLIDGDQPHGRNWRPADLRWREHGDWAVTGVQGGTERGGARPSFTRRGASGRVYFLGLFFFFFGSLVGGLRIGKGFRVREFYVIWTDFWIFLFFLLF